MSRVRAHCSNIITFILSPPLLHEPPGDQGRLQRKRHQRQPPKSKADCAFARSDLYHLSEWIVSFARRDCLIFPKPIGSFARRCKKLCRLPEGICITCQLWHHTEYCQIFTRISCYGKEQQ